MTATPIPRTLALTVYGDLDVSVIRELPPGRLPIKTVAKPESRRDEVYAVRARAARRRPAGVRHLSARRGVGQDRSEGGDRDGRSPGQEVFPAYRVGLLHGRMKADAKDRVMKAFAAGELQMLVSTTVVEVGIDVPNASVMLVEHAERFGLSQLHQLRGRVGRGAHQSYCFLLYQSPLSDEARERLKAMTDTTDGFADRRARPAAARPGRLLRHAPGRAPDVPADRSGRAIASCSKIAPEAARPQLAAFERSRRRNAARQDAVDRAGCIARGRRPSRIQG